MSAPLSDDRIREVVYRFMRRWQRELIAGWLEVMGKGKSGPRRKRRTT